jgi:hypothetical protein
MSRRQSQSGALLHSHVEYLHVLDSSNTQHFSAAQDVYNAAQSHMPLMVSERKENIDSSVLRHPFCWQYL